MARSPVDRLVGSARRRLAAQAFLDRLASAGAAALGLGLAWILVEPLLLAAPPHGSRWRIAGAAVALAVGRAAVATVRAAPGQLATALAVDSRFGLDERITSALSLSDEMRATPAGQAVLADAAEQARALRARDRFPVRPRRSAVWVPGLAACSALVAFVYHPIVDSGALAEWQGKRAESDAARLADAGAKPPPPRAPRPERKNDPDRPNKSDAVKALEAALDRLERQAREAPGEPADVREKVTEITDAEDGARRAERERTDKLTRLERQLRQLVKLDAQDAFKDGPGKDFNRALAGGDLEAAEEAIDELRKKAEERKLDPKERDALAQQLGRMKDELERLSRNADEREKLERLIAKAKQEGRDADALEREMGRQKLDAEQLKALRELSEKLRVAQDALNAEDMERLAKELERVGEQMRDLRGEAEDLKDVRQHIARLKELKEATIARGQGEAGRPGVGPGKAVDPGAGGTGQGSGRKPEDPNAPTARGSTSAGARPSTPRAEGLRRRPPARPSPSARRSRWPGPSIWRCRKRPRPSTPSASPATTRRR